MKFITEMELRDLYKTEPFTTFVLEQDTKITPGARQFLVDRRVTLALAQSGVGNKASTNESKREPELGKWCTLRLRGKMDYIESLFFLIAAELLSCGDAVQAEEVMALGTCFRNVRNAEREQSAPGKIQFWGWTEEEIKERASNLETFIDLSEFHVGVKNGKEIALLNHLRASLREIEPAIMETYWDEEKQVCLRQDLVETVNLMVNILCIMAWKYWGEQRCKR
ncbi:MAG: hypothetical protein H6Q67_1011 [Firmicutes bacterium]|nr:hypothetical protein [Bacillota bacterium]